MSEANLFYKAKNLLGFICLSYMFRIYYTVIKIDCTHLACQELDVTARCFVLDRLTKKARGNFSIKCQLNTNGSNTEVGGKKIPMSKIIYAYMFVYLCEFEYVLVCLCLCVFL